MDAVASSFCRHFAVPNRFSPLRLLRRRAALASLSELVTLGASRSGAAGFRKMRRSSLHTIFKFIGSQR
jgi:hypothetical protein